MKSESNDHSRHWILRLLLDGASIATGIAAIVAIWLGLSQQRQAQQQLEFTLKQAAEDRQRYEDDRTARIRPFVAFESSFARVLLEINGRKEYRFDFARDEAGLAKNLDEFPVLRNYGAGPAFDVEVQFLSDPELEADANARPSAISPRHIFPQATATCLAIPGALNNPLVPSQFVRGRVLITCRDLTGAKREFSHPFHASVNLEDGKWHLTLQIDKIDLPVDFTAEQNSMYQ